MFLQTRKLTGLPRYQDLRPVSYMESIGHRLTSLQPLLDLQSTGRVLALQGIDMGLPRH